MSNSPDRDVFMSSIDGNCVTKHKNKIPMRLRLSRVLSFNGLKSPKSPRSVSSSRVFNHGSPRISRYSWQPEVFDLDNRSPRSESGISTMPSSPKSTTTEDSSNSPSISPCSTTWYTAKDSESSNEIEEINAELGQISKASNNGAIDGRAHHIRHRRLCLKSYATVLVVGLFRTSSRNHDGSMQRRRHDVRDHEDEHPTTSTTAVCRPNDRVGVENLARQPKSSKNRQFRALRARLQRSNTNRSDMKYSPQQQQQQQKQRKSESSDVASVDATLSRTSASAALEQRKSSSASSSTRATICRSPSTGMFAWMRVFRLASMLHQVGC
ncbi:hypothetical protein HN011_006634 [Eciton burchellii]|nr:hypothetical protein HN011_006634 [Eciton burchellii]